MMRRLSLVVAVCGALSAGLAFGVGSAAVSPGGTVYDAIPHPLPPNVSSVGFQANHTAEFGDYVHLAGTGRTLSAVTVTMSDHALYSDYSSDPRYAGNSTSWKHPITLNIYTNHLDANGVPDQKIATVTRNVTIPWRPVADPTCSDPSRWRASNGSCYSGIAFNASFSFGAQNVTLPNDVIVSVAFNTETFGSAPIGVPGPYISLNVGAPDGGTATIGTDDNPDAVFINAERAAYYSNGCAGGVVGMFCQDTGWAPNGTLPFQIEVRGCQGLPFGIHCSPPPR